MLDLSRLFDESLYINKNPDVAEALAIGVFESGFQHFLTFGQDEGREFSPFFDNVYYLEDNPDVAEAVAAGTFTAIEHFVNFGQFEGRDPIVEFFTDFYLEAYLDVASVVATGAMTAYQHFRDFGLSEGREPGFGFDRPFYLANNPDVAAAVNAGQLSAIEHYLRFGKAEGRLGTPTLNLNAATELGLLSTVEINSIVSDRNPLQLYRFTLENPSDFNLELGGLSADADVTLLRDINENGEIDIEEIIDLSTNEGTTPEVLSRGLTAGTYFIAIERFEGNANYTLLMSAAPRLDIPPDNVGNTLSQSFDLDAALRGPLSNQGRIPINAVLASEGFNQPQLLGDFNPSDIYSFTIIAPTRFLLNLDQLSGDADVAIAGDRNEDGIISYDEIIISSENEGTQPEEIFIPKLSLGEYYILVEPFEGETTYNLTVETAPIQFPLSEALEVGTLNPTPRTLTGTLFEANLADTYRFNLTTPSDIQINLEGLSAATEVYLIQDVNNNGIVEGGEILSSAPGPEKLLSSLFTTGGYSSDAETLSVVGLPAGTYYVGVNQFEGETNYSLSLSGTSTTGRFNSLFGYGLVNASAAVARALGEPALAPVPALTSTATRNNTRDMNLINAPAVWNRGFTGEGVIVAVLDDGVDWKHPDLADNIWVNSNEIPNNGMDDDGNGFIDDVRGWDFVDGINNPSGGPGDSHGTHVAGTVAAGRNGVDIVTGENRLEMNGVAYNATIMPVRVLGESKSNPDENFDPVAAGIYYAVENGARVIQMSLGRNPGAPPSLQTQEALAFARERGVVAVIASGNERDTYGATQPGDPAFNARNNLAIAIGAVNPANQLATFSNPAGPSPLNFIVAPGVDVLSTYPNQNYEFEEGTSMAAPHISGVVALMLQANPNLTPAQVEQILIETAQPEGITLALA
ncbi:S8 family serine peptidase [Laspinema olomoucense]|uniref:S8 family serine peptidase n=1 Tax=Laspinema olomoucense D3b TaxID=2953688 RepID=A0ABT2NF04_9CYAN|nr:S8 family serine peptidase [Laspinema sp. D3b]MCT7981292.1 S8 family serine peptidase [Laspinema sp. D3b]